MTKEIGGYQPSEGEIRAAEEHLTRSEARMSRQLEQEHHRVSKSRRKLMDPERNYTMVVPIGNYDDYKPGEWPPDSYYKEMLAQEQNYIVEKEERIEEFKQRVIEAREKGDPRPQIVEVIDNLIKELEEKSLLDDAKIVRDYSEKLTHFFELARRKDRLIYPTMSPALAKITELSGGGFGPGHVGGIIHEHNDRDFSGGGWQSVCDALRVENTYEAAKNYAPKSGEVQSDGRTKIDMYFTSKSDKVDGLSLQTRLFEGHYDIFEVTSAFSGAAEKDIITKLIFDKEFCFRLRYFDADPEDEADKQAEMGITDPGYQLV